MKTMERIDWKNELKRMLDVIEKEAAESLDKINQQFDVLALLFNDEFRKNVLEEIELRLESSFTKIALENWDKRHSTVQIFILTTADEMLTIEVKLSDTVEIVKEKIQAIVGLPPDVQRLRYKDQSLYDECSLLHYNIRNGSTLELYMRQCGC